MSDWTEFETAVAAATTRTGGECSVARMLRELPDDGRTAVQDALNGDNIQVSAIARALRARIGDTAPGAYALRRHRRTDCSCGRKKDREQ